MTLHPSKDIQLTAGLAVICAAIALTPVLSAARLPAGLLLALCLPGYGLARLLLPRSMGRPELAACVLGLSLVATILGGLLLNVAPGQLGRPAWAVFLAALTVACCAVASLRNPGEPEPSYRDLVSRAAAKTRAAGRPIVLLVSLVTIAMTGVALAVSVQASTATGPSLRLWLKPLAGHHVQVGVTPGAGTGTGLVLVAHAGAKQSRLALPSLNSAQTFVKTLAVPVGAAEIVVDLDQGTRTLRHVQYWYSPTGSR